ncbi:ankyrin repeat-containing domain protein [Chaetomium fimeti]|uniref:Ankyrin repeat-containing domain protein n=1 Tax=Chaetomium fimeti TaxID=1854472 RepID=A0AAE0H723_9PEZI|nr:ankyrin repeat-containing domain protein [Chaetomium fimeti]
MAQVATLSVQQQCWNLKDDSPSLASWRIREDPQRPISWTPQAQARPKRLRKTECRELFNPNNTLPTIYIHGAACRCAETKTENELQDAALATRIASLTRTILATTTRPPPPITTSTTTNTTTATTTHPTKPPRRRHSRSPSHSPPRPAKRIPTRSSSSSTLQVLSTLARLFLPSSPPTTPSLPLQADLCIGCADLDIDKVARYLIPGAASDEARNTLPVNAPNHLGVTPLMAAVRAPRGSVWPAARLEMVRFLVEACGADVHAVRVDRVTGVGESVLSMACAGGAVGVVRYLLGRGVDVDERLPCGRGIGSLKGVVVGKGRTALHVAVAAGRAECVEVLVREGRADVDVVFDAAEGERDAGKGGEGGLKGLRVKARSVSRESLGRGKGPKHPVTALHLAHNNYACAQVLLQCGANISVRDGHGRTPLYWAAEAGKADVVRLLVGAGADMNAASDDWVTPLNAVVASLENGNGSHGHAESLRVLLQGEGHSDSGSESQDEGRLDNKLVALKTWCDMWEGSLEDEGIDLAETGPY